MNFHWQISTFNQLSTADLYQLLRLRQDVFVLEQACLYQDLDGLDQDSVHLLCRRERELLAYQRCLPPGLSYPESSIGRIVVAPGGRGLNLGRELVRRGVEFNLGQWPGHDIRIGAQSHLRNFYEDLGFTAAGEEYVEDGIPHLQMLYPRESG